jgi:(S)-sulfolactate dehydrogenase
MSRIVITEFMDERAVGKLATRNDVLYDAALVDDAARLAHEAAGCDALIVRHRTQVRGALLDALARCRVVGRLGVGLDNIDVAACEAKGIEVIPATGANALSVAEYVVGTAMVLLRGVYQATAAVASGAWPRAALSSGREIAGKTLGLVGFGSIGRLTGKLARSVGMEVAACDAMLDVHHPAYAAAGVRAATAPQPHPDAARGRRHRRGERARELPRRRKGDGGVVVTAPIPTRSSRAACSRCRRRPC